MKKVSTCNLASNGESQINRITSIALLLFVISLPLYGIEWDFIGVERFELKITMITFFFLFIAWFMRNIIFQRKRTAKEKLFYFLALIYASSQFLSLINSPYPMESLKQAVIMICFLTMMIVVSETVPDRETTFSVLTVMGRLSLIIATAGVITYYFINNNYYHRLGDPGTILMGIIYLGGDSYYFGDILLFSSGAVFLIIMKFFQKWYAKLISLNFLFLWFSALILTYTKGLIVAAVSFLLMSLFLLKGKRSFILLCLILFIAAISVNSRLTGYFQLKKFEQTNKGIVLTESDRKEKMNLITGKFGFNLFMREQLFSSLHNMLGSHSLYIRSKLIEVSLIKSMDYFWFGHGAGLSEQLLPQMMYIELNKIEVGSNKPYDQYNMLNNWQSVKRNLLDSHVLFITEFFNVGIIGALSLTCLVLFVLIELFRVVKNSVRETDIIPSLLFATIISMLIFRLFGSLIVVPFLWFMLGFAFGVCKIYGEYILPETTDRNSNMQIPVACP
jgi:hypothetical protein